MRRTILSLALAAAPAIAFACSSNPKPPETSPVASAWTPGSIARPGFPSASTVASVESPAAPPTYTLEQLLKVHKSWDAKELFIGRFAYLSDAQGTAQLYAQTDGVDHALTNEVDRISGYVVVPDAQKVVYLKDSGGDENDQLYLLDVNATIADGENARALTHSPKVKHASPVVDEKGKKLAFTSNARNGKDMDLYVESLDDMGTKDAKPPKPFLELKGSFGPLDWLGDWILVQEARSNVDQDLWLMNAKTKEKKLVTKHKGDVAYVGGAFSYDGKVIYALTDAGRDFVGLSAIDAATFKRTPLVEIDHDLGHLAVARFGGLVKVTPTLPGDVRFDFVSYAVNVDGVEHVETLMLKGHTPEGPPRVFPNKGVVTTIHQTAYETYFSIEDERTPTEAFVVDGSKETEAKQLTHTDHAGVDPANLVSAKLLTYKTFDGLDISYFWFAKDPPAGTKMPVIVNVHGGPEAQFQPAFSGVTQYLALHGFAIAAPNVRGSMGYGKKFSHLDDVAKREDSVHDLSELGKALTALPNVDGARIALLGGSYGGYMVLAGLTLYPEQWAAGVDIVGIANFRTFLEKTAAYRRANREAEYGSLAKDGAVLDAISPIHKVDKIKAPLMVIHGTNDPRVPVEETKQIADALKAKGSPVELMIFDDEGHGLAKLKNKLVAYPAVVSFLEKYVKGK